MKVKNYINKDLCKNKSNKLKIQYLLCGFLKKNVMRWIKKDRQKLNTLFAERIVLVPFLPPLTTPSPQLHPNTPQANSDPLPYSDTTIIIQYY